MIYYGWGVVPEEYQKCMVGMKRNLKQTLEIRENASYPKVKIQGLEWKTTEAL
jgi:hypothetical protein